MPAGRASHNAAPSRGRPPLARSPRRRLLIVVRYDAEETLSAALVRYDRAYYDRWYRHPRHRVATAAERGRRVALVLAVAEWVLGRAVRSVLDVGCGEALWRAPLRERRPRLRYDGVDPSPYVAERFGASRGVRLGSLDTLPDVALRAPYDLVLCVDVLHLLSAASVVRGLRALRPLLGGVAYLPAFTSADAFDGDVRAVRRRPPSWYRRQLRDAGFVPVGLECYVTRDGAALLSALERAEP